MRIHHLMLLCIGILALPLGGCWKPWDNGKDDMAAMKPASDKEVPSTAIVAPDEPVRVVLMDQATRRELWVINTTRSHISLLPDTGGIKVDGQLWDGPYKIVKK